MGSFEAGYELDAVVLDDSCIPYPRRLSLAERLERLSTWAWTGTGSWRNSSGERRRDPPYRGKKRHMKTVNKLINLILKK